jgi:hypothetical protein
VKEDEQTAYIVRRSILKLLSDDESGTAEPLGHGLVSGATHGRIPALAMGAIAAIGRFLGKNF